MSAPPEVTENSNSPRAKSCLADQLFGLVGGTSNRSAEAGPTLVLQIFLPILSECLALPAPLFKQRRKIFLLRQIFARFAGAARAPG